MVTAFLSQSTPQRKDTAMKTPPGTRPVTANQLQIGDVLVNDDGTFDEEVLDVFVDYGDSSKTWLETATTMGYLSSYQNFLIEE